MPPRKLDEALDERIAKLKTLENDFCLEKDVKIVIKISMEMMRMI